MTTFDSREQAFESQFVHDAEIEFKVTVRRNKLVGLWAAQQMGLADGNAEDYAQAVVRSDFHEAGDDDIVGKVLSDLTAAGIDISDHGVRKLLDEKAAEARRDVMSAT